MRNARTQIVAALQRKFWKLRAWQWLLIAFAGVFIYRHFIAKPKPDAGALLIDPTTGLPFDPNAQQTADTQPSGGLLGDQPTQDQTAEDQGTWGDTGGSGDGSSGGAGDGNGGGSVAPGGAAPTASQTRTRSPGFYTGSRAGRALASVGNALRAGQITQASVQKSIGQVAADYQAGRISPQQVQGALRSVPTPRPAASPAATVRNVSAPTPAATVASVPRVPSATSVQTAIASVKPTAAVAASLSTVKIPSLHL